MNESPLEFVRRFFDFEYEDQPDELVGYNEMIDYMWRKAISDGLNTSIYRDIAELILSGKDAATEMDFMFMPGKHEVEDILKLILARAPAGVEAENSPENLR